MQNRNTYQDTNGGHFFKIEQISSRLIEMKIITCWQLTILVQSDKKKYCGITNKHAFPFCDSRCLCKMTQNRELLIRIL